MPSFGPLVEKGFHRGGEGQEEDTNQSPKGQRVSTFRIEMNKHMKADVIASILLTQYISIWGYRGGIYWWTTFQCLYLLKYFGWRATVDWERATQVTTACFASLTTTLALHLLLLHWPNVYLYAIGPMATANWRLTLERHNRPVRSVRTIPAFCCAHWWRMFGGVCPWKFYACVFINSSNNNKNVCLCHPWWQWRNSFSFMARSQQMSPAQDTRICFARRTQWRGGSWGSR